VTETRKPKHCHHDRTLKARVTNDHRDDCPTHTGGPCPAQGRGCAPCTAPHCVICGREHVTNDQPFTCAECIGRIRADLSDIRRAYLDLAREAVAGGGDGSLVAAAPIPGGNAAVLIGPTVRLDLIRVARGLTPDILAKDHRPTDPIPPLAVLAQWEDMYRAWLTHTRGVGRATIGRAITYLDGQLDYLANHVDKAGPDFVAFTRQLRDLRAQLERALHDEREPEYGVECFECGDRLVRRFRDRHRCRHWTDARRWLATLRTYPELTIYQTEFTAARLPCSSCNQGGLDDPRAGLSWECPGCRKEYTPGEYHTAVRRDLLDNADAWTTIVASVGAAATLTGWLLGDKTVRSWVGRGWVKSKFDVRSDGLPGMRLVFWPDVKREAMRLAAGRHHCKHQTPARDWLKVLACYPEIPVLESEIDDARIECEECAEAVERAFSVTRGAGVA
jgi:hypothetical protein